MMNNNDDDQGGGGVVMNDTEFVDYGEYIPKCRHSQYVVVNDEWVLVNRGLSGYLEQLRIGIDEGGNGNYVDRRCNFERIRLMNYEGIDEFYLRRIYRHEYEGGGYKCKLDPWNRVFPVFPNNGSKPSKMLMYDYEYFHSSIYVDVDDVRNVCVVSTSVNGDRVYCVDILSV